MTEPTAAPTRRTRVRRLLGLLTAALVVGVVSACGSQTSSTHAGAPPQGPAAGPVKGARVLPLISMTAAGGRPSTHATLLDTPAHVAAFNSQFRGSAVSSRVEDLISVARRHGFLVYGAVVSVGCDRPPGASVALDDQGEVVITPGEVASPLQECLAPVTTVAVAIVPGAQ
jgi:hypothetical protein